MTDWTILTGDIVKSTQMSAADLERVFYNLRTAGQLVSGWQGTPARLTRFRGDGWQMAVTPVLTLRAALLMRACVRRIGKGFDTRIGLGTGPAAISGDDLAGASGSAFVASGRALDGIGRKTRLNAPEAPVGLRVALPLADHILGNWTMRQAGIAYFMLAPDPPTQAAIAKDLGQARQTVQRHVDSSGVAALVAACLELEGQTQ